MKKILLSSFISFLYPITALAGATAPGIYVTTSNLNIRSTPQLIENRINHFKKGDQVIVTKILDQWCQIKHPRHPVAFVKCSYLSDQSNVIQSNQTTATNPPVTTSEPVGTTRQKYASPSQLIDNLSDWLNTDDLGNNYINDTFWNAQQKAKFWDETAALSDFQLFYDGSGQIFCRYSFSGSGNAEEYFLAQCLDQNLTEVSSSIVQSNKVPKTFTLPSILFQDFITKLQQSTQLQQDLATFFPMDAQLSARFRLNPNREGQLLWSMDLFDLRSGKTKSISLDANSPSASLIY